MHPDIFPIFKSTLPEHLYDMSPEELKIYTLLCFITTESQVVSISSYNLSLRSNLKWKVVVDNLSRLQDRALVQFTEQPNPFLDMTIKICSSNSIINTKSKSNNRNDNDSNILLKNDEQNRNDVEKQKNKKNDNAPSLFNNKSKQQDSEDDLADRIARELDDEQNIGLYKSYCQRFPKKTIEKALEQTKKVPDEKIKKSKGALFNFLVQRFNKE